MKRVTASGLADNTVQTPLTVPAGKKYEVLESSINHLNGAGVLMAESAVRGGVATATYFSANPPQFPNVERIVHNALCLEAGDIYRLAVLFSGGVWSYSVTYMDVDT